MKNSIKILSKLPLEFYKKDLLDIAKELLGKAFIRQSKGNTLAGIIVEVEAYDGEVDEAAHSYKGKTERNKVMFDEGGVLYVYFIYGIHYCCNVVTGLSNEGKAILIRAVEPFSGIEILKKNRFGNIEKKGADTINLTNGPAKVASAFGIDKNQNGINLTGDEIFIAETNYPNNFEIVETTRIGITKSKELLWRFYIKNNSNVSVK